MTDLIKLYYAPDNASLIVRMVLEELALSFETELVDRRVSEQNSDAYRKLNPRGLIPVCIIDGAPVFETAAIILTLAERFASASLSLAPAQQSHQRPQFLKWLFFISNNLHADLRSMFYPQYFIGSAEPTDFRAFSRTRIDQALIILNEAYGSGDRSYLFGDEPSIVDIYLATCLRWAQLYPMALRGQIKCCTYPELQRMVVCLQQRPAIRKACEAEGISGEFFTNPDYANPVEGSAL